MGTKAQAGEDTLLNRTQSVCPMCLACVSAEIIERGGRVLMLKRCPDHGAFETLLWTDSALYLDWTEQARHAPVSLDAIIEDCDCPYSCGLCKGHEGDTCTSIFHLTDRCNMRCPVCFAAAGSAEIQQDLALPQIEVMYDAACAKTCTPTVQLSGGEPTLRDDLPEIVAMGKERGVRHIQVNTNGLRLAREPEYATYLAEAGCDLVYLQFDGVTNDVYRTLRGRDLMAEKLQAIAACERAGLGVLLVVTVYPGVNMGQLGDIVQFAKEHMPTVKGIQVQPVTHMGRFGNDGSEGDVITFPDVLKAMEEQTGGEVSLDAIVPRHKASGVCSFSSTFFLAGDGRLRAMTHAGEQHEVEHDAVDGFVVEAVDFADKFWRASQECCCGDGGEPKPDSLVEALRARTLAISGMHFQDAWNLDLERLRGCCVHVMTPEGRSIPFCAYYLTAQDGTRLYDACGLHHDKASEVLS